MEQIAAPEKSAIRIGPFGSALKKHEYSEVGVRVLGIEDVFPNELVSEKRKYIPEPKFRELSQYTVKPGDLLVTNMGTVGRTCVVPDDLEKSIISSHLIKISLDTHAAWPPYVSWMLNFCPLVVAQIKAKCHGAIMAGFNSGLLKQLRIPLPPLAEQRRIAEVLDRAEALRAKRRHALAQLDILTQAIFLEMFGDPVTNPKHWEAKPFAKVLENAEVFVDGDWVESKDQNPDGAVRLIQLADVGDGIYLNKSARFLTPEKAADLRCTFLRTGDVLVARMPDPLGRACIFPGEHQECVTVVDVCIIRPSKGGPDIYWLVSCINSDSFRKQVARHATGTTRERISRGNLSKLQVSVPPFPLQREFAGQVKTVERLKAKQRVSLAKLDSLFASLQHRAFKGDL
ncbi:MAG: restriction endonuclease subunit S [Candidatus Omnitrophota bacterium]